MIDELQIKDMTISELLSRDTLLDLQEIPEPEEKVRFSSLLIARAAQLGSEREVRDAIKAYNKADAALAAEYTKQYAESHSSISLAMDGRGQPLVTVDNFYKVFTGDPKFAGIRFNLLTHAPENTVMGVTRKWTDADDAEARRYIEKTYHLHSVQKCDDAFRIFCAQNEYHPVRDMIDALKWDGEERIEHFLTKWMGAADDAYTREVSRLIFAGGINRAYRPGCKFDDMPVLIGTKQGEGKSSIIRFLAMRDNFFAEVSQFDGQKGIEGIEGAWICEVPELSAMTKTKDVEEVKAYITRMNDRYRMPFDRRVTEHPRQCIFIGTTNREQFLTDKTGNRRFYPVKTNVSGYDLFDREAECREYIAQCWAEAKHRLDAGDMKPFADRSIIHVIRTKQGEATEDDYRIGLIEDYLADKSETCVLDLWQNAIQGDQFRKPNKKESVEIGLIMQTMPGWVKSDTPKRFEQFGLQRYWRRVGADPMDELPF